MPIRYFLLLSFLFLNLFLYTIYQDAKIYFAPQAVIVPHHDVVKSIRQKVLQEVARRRTNTQTILLLSPDHFNPDQHQLTLSDQNWSTTSGPISYDSAVGDQLKSLVAIDNSAVKNDHGITAPLPDLKAYFPQAKIVPLLLGSALSESQLVPISNKLNQICTDTCLVVASVDFSHYLPAALADVHDAYSLKVLSQINPQSALGLEVDSPQALYLALAHARSRQAPRFILKAHTNSGALMGNYDAESTSHLFGWYQPGQIKEWPFQTFVYAQDLTLNPHLKTVGERFFYGADVTQTHLSQATSPAPNLQIIPSLVSSVISRPNLLTLNLGSDLAVAGIVNPDGSWRLSLLPLTGISPDQSLARGLIKQSVLSALFSSLSPPFTADFKSGTIYYSPKLSR